MSGGALLTIPYRLRRVTGATVRTVTSCRMPDSDSRLKKIVLNLADVPYIDSAGLGEIVLTYTTVSRQGGDLKLLNLTKRITDLLSITKLLTVFETYESENDAVQSFSSAKV